MGGKGHSTEDDDEAIALAVCYDPISFGENGSNSYPICLRHVGFKSKWWKLIPLPGQSLEESHLLVREDARYFNIVSDAVSSSIKSKFPDFKMAEEIFKKIIRYSNYWGFCHNGIFYGVEDDGHIHT
jgi:hypothetical protein